MTLADAGARGGIKARPTTYNGIQMRSRLEAATAAALDRLGADWQYEPRAFGTSRRQYLPDFYIHGGAEYCTGVYIEVRPTIESFIHVWPDETETLWASTQAPLLYVGWATSPLFGALFCKGGRNDRPLAGQSGVLERIYGEIHLLSDLAAQAWLCGHVAGRTSR